MEDKISINYFTKKKILNLLLIYGKKKAIRRKNFFEL